MPPEQVIAALATVLVTVVGILWRLHLQADADDRAQRDLAASQLTAAIAGVNRLAAAIEKDTADRAERRRSDDR
ncbi:MAG TPA: hypothetical protein VGQ64_01835 [Candidatus Limnocylindrales bacterium]|nr:hypothetical protein [Candidatus Limnocylindrales bacterium]